MAFPLDGWLAAAASMLLISARGAPSRVMLRQQGSDVASASMPSTMTSVGGVLQSCSKVSMSWMASACSSNARLTDGHTHIALCAKLMKGSKTLQRRRGGTPIPLSRSCSGARLLATSPGVSIHRTLPLVPLLQMWQTPPLFFTLKSPVILAARR